MDEMAKKLVRLALACEFQRRPIRRGDISEKVLGTNGRQFKHVWNKAQSNLRDVFGMEMRELPAKEKVTLQQKRGMHILIHRGDGYEWHILTDRSGAKEQHAIQINNNDLVDVDFHTTIPIPRSANHPTSSSTKFGRRVHVHSNL